MNWLLKKVKRV